MFNLAKRPPPGLGPRAHYITNKAHDLPLTIKSAEIFKGIYKEDTETCGGYKEDFKRLNKQRKIKVLGIRIANRL